MSTRSGRTRPCRSSGASGEPTGTSTPVARSERGFRLGAAAIFTVLAVTLTVQLFPGAVPGWLAAQRDTYGALWPQGWSFFANLPEAKILVAYRVRPDGGTLAMATHPEMSRASLWGLSRVTEAQVVETTDIARQVPDRYWTACGEDYRSCGDVRRLPRYPVLNRSRRPTLCGSIAVTVEQPRRPSTDGPGNAPRRVLTIAVTEVTCTG